MPRLRCTLHTVVIFACRPREYNFVSSWFLENRGLSETSSKHIAISCSFLCPCWRDSSIMACCRSIILRARESFSDLYHPYNAGSLATPPEVLRTLLWAPQEFRGPSRSLCRILKAQTGREPQNRSETTRFHPWKEPQRNFKKHQNLKNIKKLQTQSEAL